MAANINILLVEDNPMVLAMLRQALSPMAHLSTAADGGDALLQSIDLGHKSCLLTLANAGDKCEMYFNDGQINHATCGPLKGDDAVYKVMSWTGGNFTIDFTGKSAEQSISRSTQGLLMEGMRLLDESNRDQEENVLEA